MIRVWGTLKVICVLALDFGLLSYTTKEIWVAAVVTGVIAAYTWLGGVISLLKEGAVSLKKLPDYEKTRLLAAKQQVVEDVRTISGVDISGLKLYLIPDDNTINATAYGTHSISITRGLMNTSLGLHPVLAHEISHIIHRDSELYRALFSTVLVLIGSVSVVSMVTAAVIFIAFLVFSGFQSWLGVLVYKGTTKSIHGFFRLLQKGIVVCYRLLFGVLSRCAEYRADADAAKWGYGPQLAHFLSVAVPGEKSLTLEEAIYRSHPPTEKRIARLEKQWNKELNTIHT